MNYAVAWRLHHTRTVLESKYPIIQAVLVCYSAACNIRVFTEMVLLLLLLLLLLRLLFVGPAGTPPIALQPSRPFVL
jgi:hypothetical protein